MDFLSDFYPASKVSTSFGWDIGPANRLDLDPLGQIWPRIHLGIDRYGGGIISSPIMALRTIWIRRNVNGNSILRLIGDGVEVRMYHLNECELDGQTRALILQGLPIDKGQTLGPSGNTGRSFGRHLHYEVYLDPGKADNELRAKYAERWNLDKTPFYIAQYGKVFEDHLKNKRIAWMNDHMAALRDPLTARDVYCVDARSIFGL